MPACTCKASSPLTATTGPRGFGQRLDKTGTFTSKEGSEEEEEGLPSVGESEPRIRERPVGRRRSPPPCQLHCFQPGTARRLPQSDAEGRSGPQPPASRFSARRKAAGEGKPPGSPSRSCCTSRRRRRRRRRKEKEQK
ncbi:hypothetical protein E2320_004169 [Naja naja]|nr:hypothetical protein E2320_004169 [Naja naja]